MKKFLDRVALGGSSLLNGLLALTVISLIALGCTCTGKDGFDFGGKDTETSDEKKDLNDSDDPFGEKKKEEKLSEDEVPSDNAAQEIAKTTLLNFNDAVQSADFSDFHKTISKTWKRTSRPSQFEKGFKEFIDKKINIGVIRSMSADFSPRPAIEKISNRNILVLKGSYDVSPRPVKFDLKYVFEDDEWRLLAIAVDTKG